MDNYSVIAIVSSFMWLFVMERFMRLFYEKRRTSPLVMLLTFLFVFAVSVFQHLFFRHHYLYYRAIIGILAALIGYFIITLNYESSMGKRVVVTVVTFLLSLSIEVVASVIFMLLFPSQLVYSEETINMSSIASLPLAYFLFTLLQRFKNIKKNTAFFPSVLVIPTGVLLMLFCFVFLGFAYWIDADIPSSYYAIFMGTYMMGFSFLTFYLYDRLSGLYEDKLKLALHSQERKYYFAQFQLMQKSVEQVKSIRHDMKSHLATIKGYSTKIKADEITDYLDCLLGDIRASEVYSDTGNIAFDSIINFKLQNAKKDNIKLDISLFIPQALNIEVTDIVIILGNLLDNALNAVSNVDEKMIKIDIEYSRKSLFIQIENTFDGIVKFTEGSEKEEKTLATRKNVGENGYGLKNIKHSVEKYNGYIDITYQGNTFSVAVLLYVDDM